MMYIIKTINGQKVAVPLTADTGSGNPVGTIIAQYKKTNMAGYLYLDGRDTTGTADELETVYPALYAYLGNTNVLPDYREFALVGAEENTTDVYNESTNPNGTIYSHDTFTEGQAKDDQVQSHRHYISLFAGVSNNNGGGVPAGYNTAISEAKSRYDSVTDISRCRYGDVTRGKRKAVYFYIKATSGLTESQMDSMITILNQQRSYSTEEIDTGMTYVDGKKIYKKTISADVTTYNDSSNRREFFYQIDATTIDTIVNEEGCWKWVTATMGQGRVVPVHCTNIFNTFAIAYTSYSLIENNNYNFYFAGEKDRYGITKMRIEVTIYYTKKTT